VADKEIPFNYYSYSKTL
jgi:hypothetical protein